MTIVYFKTDKTDTSGPVRFLCTLDGRIDFSLLGRKFGFEPTSIKLNSRGFPREGLKSAHKWEQIRDSFKEKELPVGAEDDPVVVTGEAAVPAVSTGLAGELPQGPQRLQVFVREAAKNYNNLLCGMNEAEKFLLVSRDPFGGAFGRDPEGVVEEDPFLIWIRECYRDLKDIMLEILASMQDWRRRFVILGTEGIGKSVFTIFWVCYLATQRVKVAWKTHPQQIFILDFSQEVATVSGPFTDYTHNAIRSVVEDHSAWLILDGQQPDPLPYECHMLLACSAKHSNHHKFLKHDLAQRFFLPVWAEEETDQFCDDFSVHRKSYGAMDVPVKEEVQANFKELGGVPRYVLKNRKMVEGRDLFKDAIKNLKPELCLNLLCGRFEPGLSDKFIHMCVGKVDGKCNYEECVYTFASSKAQIAVWEHLHSTVPQELVYYITFHWGSALLGPVVGGMYEFAAHEILRRGGPFKRKRVVERWPYEASAPDLVLGKLESSGFEKLEELKNIKHSMYCKPTSRTFESVDAVIVPDSSVDVPRLVQILKRKKGGQDHGYKLQGLKNVDDVLESTKYELLSCVPSECYNETEFQTWRNKNGEKCVQLTGDEQTLVAKMEEYVVEVDYKALVATGATA